MAGGFTTIARDGNLVMVMVLICVQMIVSGAMVVLGVVFAVDILGTGPAGVGLIDSVLGIGAVVGGFVAIARSVRNTIALDLVTGTLLWSLPLLLVVVAPSPATVFAMVAVMGFGLPLVDVNYATLTMRLTPDAGSAASSAPSRAPASARWRSARRSTPFLLDHLGVRGRPRRASPSSSGCPPSPASPAPAASTPRCGRRPEPTCSPASRCSRRSPRPPWSSSRGGSSRSPAPAGTAIVREGDPSDRFYVIVRGRVEVTQGGRHLRVEGPGEFFGEIGLLRDVPRTATVTALEDTELVSLTREDFLGAVQGTDASMAAAYDIVTSRLG